MESYRKGLRWLLRWLLLGHREQITHFHDFSARGGSCHGAVGRGWLVGETAHGVLPPPPPRPRPLLPLGAEALPKAPGELVVPSSPLHFGGRLGGVRLGSQLRRGRLA